MQSEHASDDANRRDTVLDELVSRDSAAASARSPLPLPRPRNDQRCLIANVTVLSMYSNPKLRAALELLNLRGIARGEDSDSSYDEAKKKATSIAMHWLCELCSLQSLPSLAMARRCCAAFTFTFSKCHCSEATAHW
jgi:hypothetical protein